MNSSIKSKVAGQAGNVIQQAARQGAQEPWEILKTGATQVTGVEKPATQPAQPGPSQTNAAPTAQDIETLRRQDQVRSVEQRQKLVGEIKQISERKRQADIARLAPPAQPEQPEGQVIKPVREPILKRSRRLFGFKAEVKRKQTRVENLPPTTT